ncbi:MAG: caspase family protein [Rickettsiales bacterium]
MSEQIKRAVIIGIDHYPAPYRLYGCAYDARNLYDILSCHDHKNNPTKRGKPNFDCTLLTSASDSRPVISQHISSAISELFSKEADSVLFYFSGHSKYNRALSKGYFIPQDIPKGDTGVSFDFLMDLANTAYPRIKSTTIIIDSCNSGAMGEGYTGSMDIMPSTIGTGVTILTSADKKDAAREDNISGGFFSSIITDGLRGSAADLLGNVTPASLYSHADHLLRASDQRPIYKANVKSFVVLRQCQPRMDVDILYDLPALFPEPDEVFPLNQTFEPDKNAYGRKQDSQPDPQNTTIFAKLQVCNRHGLIVPVDADHMYYAAMNETGCRLTQLGKHYRFLAEKNRL